MSGYIKLKDASEKWGILERRLRTLCSENRIEGVMRFGRAWAIPVEAKKPADARIKSGKYVKKRL